MAGSKVHHCCGAEAGNNLPGNCKPDVKIPQTYLKKNGKSWHCPQHETWCRKHPDQTPFLKNQKCKQCLGDWRAAAKAKQEAREGISSSQVVEQERGHGKNGKGKGKGKANTKNGKRGKQGKRR
jgi:hypothetical protein